jgi:hypothetical protein
MILKRVFISPIPGEGQQRRCDGIRRSPQADSSGVHQESVASRLYVAEGGAGTALWNEAIGG